MLRMQRRLAPALVLGSSERRFNYKPAAYWDKYYWQVDTDPGQRFPNGYFNVNRTQKQHLVCNMSFIGAERCPLPTQPNSVAASSDASSGMLLYATLGRLTNCVLVLEVARWLAEQLGKVLVVPLCSSGETTEQSCMPGSNRTDQREVNLLVNLSAVYARRSAGGCRHHREARDVYDVVLDDMHAAEAPVHSFTCVGKSAYNCAWMMSGNWNFASLRLNSFIEYDVGRLAIAWSMYTASRKGIEASAMHASNALRRALLRQDAGEKCSPVALSADCECPMNGTVRKRNRTIYGGFPRSKPVSTGRADVHSRACDGSPELSEEALQHPPCLRDCHGRSVFDVTPGDVFLPNLFEHAGLLDPSRHAMCPPMTLSERASGQAAALRASLPARFVCVHWRAGDFLSTEPLGRLKGKSMLSLNSALANASFMAAVAERAAVNVKATHVLVLTNARWERAKAFEHTLGNGSHGIGLTMRVCTDAPPDAEKEVCALGAQALVLSAGSSFSTHVRRMAPLHLPVESLSACPKPGTSSSTIWDEGKLLAGAPIRC